MRIDPSTDIYDRYRSRASDITCSLSPWSMHSPTDGSTRAPGRNEHCYPGDGALLPQSTAKLVRTCAASLRRAAQPAGRPRRLKACKRLFFHVSSRLSPQQTQQRRCSMAGSRLVPWSWLCLVAVTKRFLPPRRRPRGQVWWPWRCAAACQIAIAAARVGFVVRGPGPGGLTLPLALRAGIGLTDGPREETDLTGVHRL